MKRELYAFCPKCCKRAKIIKFVWDWDGEQSVAIVKCSCGKWPLPYSESRVLKIDFDNCYMHEAHFDLLVPPGWNQDMWNKLSKCFEW